MSRVAIIVLGCLTVIFFVLGLNNYRQVNQLKKENQELQQKIKNLSSRNQYYQQQINTQLIEQSTKENEEDAEQKAARFTRIYHNTSMNPEERLQQLKSLMVPDAYNKWIKNTKQQEEEDQQANSNVETRVDIKNIKSFKDGEIQKVNIDFDYVRTVDNKESFVEKMNIIVHMVVNNGKWLVNDFELTYKEGPDEHVD